LFPYVTPVIELIIRLKFQRQLSHAQAFGELMCRAISTNWYVHKPLPELIIPVPLHRQRLRERGFNQALEIARPIAKTLAIPVDITGIRRIRDTRAQSGLPAARRKDNIAHAFAAEREYHGSHIAILDDVITTGYTIRELSKELKSRGASRIDIWCCARRG
jgi:ComF family protein